MILISKLYTIQELQEILHISKNQAYKIVKIKGFPNIQIGKKILIPEDDLNKWIKENLGNKITI